MLRIYKTYNLSMRFSKYKFYNKLLRDITLLKVIVGGTLSQFKFIYLFIFYRHHQNK